MTAFSGAATPLSDADYAAAAAHLGVDVPTIRAVTIVETGGHGGFLSDGSGRPVILFEAEHFSRLTCGIHDQSHPAVSCCTWNRTLYKGGAAEYDRLEAAFKLDDDAALKSASWGMFQIMGENYRACGFGTVDSFVAAMESGDDAQLEAFVAFVQSDGAMLEALRGHDWADFARLYNGPGYAANHYDTRLSAAYAAACGSAPPPGTIRIGAANPTVALLQDALNRSGANPRLAVDGKFGVATQLAIERFQAAHPATLGDGAGVAGPAVRAVLGL